MGGIWIFERSVRDDFVLMTQHDRCKDKESGMVSETADMTYGRWQMTADG